MTDAGEGDERATPWRRALQMSALVFAGEAVFSLPFILPRVFRTTLLEVFAIDNLQFGVAFSVYGLVAMVAYLVGGPLADRFSARRMMTVALLATAAGGLVVATIPPVAVLRGVYGWWGLTTVLLFWAPLIRATREWGGDATPGRAYGLLDGGRGLFAALVASVSVVLFALVMPEQVVAAAADERRAAFVSVVLAFTGFTSLAALFVWLVVPDRAPTRRVDRPRMLAGLRNSSREPTVWLQALIVLAAYVGYKSADDYALFASHCLGYDEVEAARAGTISMWVRPFAAVAVGLWGDRLGISAAVSWCFGFMIAGSLVIAGQWLGPGASHLALVMTIVATGLGVHGLRGLYFALFGESRFPWQHTGSAIGLVSIVGYTPDVFMGPLMGAIIDASPNARGHAQLFSVVAVFGALGLTASWLFRRKARLGRDTKERAT